MTPALRHLAARVAATDPAFLGHALLTYQLRTGAGDAELCRVLGCDPDTLVRLALCRTPRDAAEVERVETGCGLAAGALATILDPGQSGV